MGNRELVGMARVLFGLPETNDETGRKNSKTSGRDGMEAVVPQNRAEGATRDAMRLVMLFCL